jgi:hypothetical protein
MTHSTHQLITINNVPPDLELRKESVHVNMSVVSQLRHEFWCEKTVDVGREVAQRILHSQLKRKSQSGLTLVTHWE